MKLWGLSGIVICLLLISCGGGSQPMTLLFEETWPAGSVIAGAGSNWATSGNTLNPTNYSFDTAVFNEGIQSVKFLMDRDDGSNGSTFRSELTLKSNFGLGGGSISQILEDTEYWWGFAQRLDPAWVIGKTDLILAQLHGSTGSPPLELRTGDSSDIDFNGTEGNFDVYKIQINNDALVSPQGAYNLGAFNPGVWEAWVYNFRLSSTDPTSFVKLWRNGVVKLDITGITQRSDQGNSFVKHGLHNPRWRSPPAAANVGESPRIQWVGSIRIGDSNSSFDEVDPARGLQAGERRRIGSFGMMGRGV